MRTEVNLKLQHKIGWPTFQKRWIEWHNVESFGCFIKKKKNDVGATLAHKKKSARAYGLRTHQGGRLYVHSSW